MSSWLMYLTLYFQFHNDRPSAMIYLLHKKQSKKKRKNKSNDKKQKKTNQSKNKNACISIFTPFYYPRNTFPEISGK